MKTIVILFAAVLFSTNIFSQKRLAGTDSLLSALTNSREDTDRIRLYTQLAGNYFSTQPDSFFIFCHRGIELASRLKRKKDLVALNFKMSTMLSDTGNYALALKYAEENLAITQELDWKLMIISSYVEMGRVYNFQADFVKSADYFFKALAIARQINDHEQTALVGTNLSAAYFNQGDYKKAEAYSFATLEEAKIAHAPVHIYKALYTIGMIKAIANDSSAARDYYGRAIEVCQKNALTLNEAEVINDLSSVEGSMDKRIELLLRARRIYDSLGPALFGSRVNWLNLGEAYISNFRSHRERNDFLRKAEQNLKLFTNKSLEANDRLSYAQGLNDLAEVNELKGDFQKAYAFSTEYHAINDSIYSQKNKNAIAEIQSRNELGEKNLEIEKQKLQLREQKKNAFLFLAGSLLMAAFGLLFYRLSAVRKQKNKELTQLNKELDEANKLKAKFFGILSHDLRSPIANLVNFLNLRRIRPDALNKEQTEERENMISSAARTLLETMESMLLWSKSQMQQFRPEKKSVGADTLFSYIRKNFAANGDVSFLFSDEGKINVETDEDYLKTIMYNLTANSIKALQNIPGAKVEWKAWKENGNTFFSITDNGPGIDNEKMRALYDDSIASSGKEGLGLHIIRDLAKAIGCRISIQKYNEGGASFLLAL